MNTNQGHTGDDNVIMGDIGNRNISGNRNTIIGATDANGNTILNRPMIIGYNAKGGPNDIVIGVNAGAGSDIFLLLDQLRQAVAKKGDNETATKIIELLAELKKPTADKEMVSVLWNSIKTAVTIGEAFDLAARIGPLIYSIVK